MLNIFGTLYATVLGHECSQSVPESSVMTHFVHTNFVLYNYYVLFDHPLFMPMNNEAFIPRLMGLSY
jgi:hypothetical protein